MMKGNDKPVKEIRTEKIHAGNDLTILVETRERDGGRDLAIRMKSRKDCRLHWGLSRNVGSSWKMPPPSSWPRGSVAFSETAVQTSFVGQDGENRVDISLDKDMDLPVINFALFYPDSGSWDNNGGKNYHIEFPARERAAFSPSDIRREMGIEGKILYEADHVIDREGTLSIAVIKDDDRFRIMLLTNIPGSLLLHWGAALRSPYEWTLPSEALHPRGTALYDERAVQTAFIQKNDIHRLTFQISLKEAPLGIPFVLAFSGEERWIKQENRNFYIPVAELLETGGSSGSSRFSHVVREIVGAEMGKGSWTLMHRFNLCYDLLEKAGREEEGLALLFVWLRYSSLRQLDWQRNYNTKPKELSHAQDRLTLKLAGLFHGRPENREFIRLLLSTLGRGGEGQRIRDEILHIMHRHRIKEVSGHFLEEWHQKLHNNTTPDDIDICRAYIEFLKSDGNLDVFYRTLEEGGVTKERLESFERPIVTPPDFVPHLKDALIYDFENYLKLFKSVHSGTDLESAAAAAGYALDDHMRGTLDYILQQRHSDSVAAEEIAGQITSLRFRLSDILNGDGDHGRLRDLLYLDIALEEFLRVVIESNLQRDMDSARMVDLLGMVLKNTLCSTESFEFSECAQHWERLASLPRFGHDWSLHAKSVLDRAGRAVSEMSDRYYELLQEKAEHLGKAFQAERWTINIFSEDVVRGRLSFLLSLLIHHLDPVLRKHAHLGDWQIISPGQGTGVVETVDTFGSVQGRIFTQPTIIIADSVSGDEEPPDGIKAVITRDLVDLVAHVAIRARNGGVLFATCYDSAIFDRLKSRKGQPLTLSVSAAGDVIAGDAEAGPVDHAPAAGESLKELVRPNPSGFALASRDFRENLVGGKSLNLQFLRGRLPDWIHMPSSAAIPFGVAEKVLALDMNKKAAERYSESVRNIGDNPGEALQRIREGLLELKAPGELLSSLRRVMDESGIEWPADWDEAWMCIKKVWASKWNERAYISRRTRRIPHEDLFMAVLIQEVVEAEYAFVIHTVNPFSGDRGELYAEMVAGLGETLVGNYPGRALSFTSGKAAGSPVVTAYPSKSAGLFGGGTIFRSDSNGEDLTGYAGAGLYDSFLLRPPEKVPLKYSEERFIWDEDFRMDLCRKITDLGTAIEKIMNSPQDIEGAYAKGRFYVVQTRPQV